MKMKQQKSFEPQTTENSANLQRMLPALMLEQDEEAVLYMDCLKGDKTNIDGARFKVGYSGVPFFQ